MKRQGGTQGSPLTLKQLREMNGQPGYWAEEKRWGIICVDSAGRWAGVPFFKFRLDGVNFEYNIKSRRMKIYRSPSPTKLVRAAWEPCKYCSGEKTLYQKTHHTKLYMNTFGCASTLVTECSRCPPYAKCCMKDIPANSVFKINFCPECGRPLTDEAWEMLEKRLEKGKDNEKY